MEKEITLTQHKKNKKELALRLITGFAGAALIIASIIAGEWTYFAIFLLISLLTLGEFYKLAGLDGMIPLKFWGIFTALSIFVIAFFIEKGMLVANYYFAIFPLLFITFFIKLYKKDEKKPFTGIAFTFLGLIYVAVPFSLLHSLVYFQEEYRHEIIVGLLALIWAGDTGAYFAGTKFGKRKLFFRISPKKSWEGFIGGSILILAVATALAALIPLLPWWQWIVIAIIIIVAGTYGDLVESLLKRSLSVKDSGNAIPGHGGFLDRFDSLVLSVPFIAAFLELVRF